MEPHLVEHRSWSHHLVKFIAPQRHLQDPSVFFSGQVGEEMGGNHHSEISQVCDGGANLCNPLGMWFYYFPR